MGRLIALVATLVLGAACACTKPVPHIVVPLDASDAASSPPGDSPEARACARLEDAGCPEGQRPNCADVLLQAEQDSPMSAACILAAGNELELHACGVRCKRP